MHSLNVLHYKEANINYKGEELSPHWIYKKFGVLGNTLVSFIGEADVTLDHMVDLEDVKKQAPIYSPKMLHFIGEFFIDSLNEGILLQHMLVMQLMESLLQRKVAPLTRRGNDIYYQERKMSVSIATKSLVSVLVHFGINIETKGTPIPTAGLSELSINPEELANEILEKMKRDWVIWNTARVKVQPR